MAAYPLLGGEGLHTVIESLVDVFPVGHEIGNRRNSLESSVRILDEYVVEFGMFTRAESQNLQGLIMNGGQMAQDVHHSVAAGSDLLIKLVLRQTTEKRAQSRDRQPPITEDGLDHQLLCFHGDISFGTIGVGCWFRLLVNPSRARRPQRFGNS